MLVAAHPEAVRAVVVVRSVQVRTRIEVQVVRVQRTRNYLRGPVVAVGRHIVDAAIRAVTVATEDIVVISFFSGEQDRLC